MANQQRPSNPKPPGKPGGKPAGRTPGKGPGQPSGKPRREPAPAGKSGGGRPPPKTTGKAPAPAKSRAREPRPAAATGPREGRLVAGHEEDLLYGRHAVAEALRAGRRHIRRIFLAEGVDRTGILSEIVAFARLVGAPVVEMRRDRMDDAVGANHQGVVAQAAEYPYLDLDELVARGPSGDRLYLALDHLQDVQNLGTLLRTAEAMGAAGVLLPGRRSAAVTPAVVNASSGAVEHLRIALVGNLAQALEALKAEGVWVAGLDATAEAKTLSQTDLTGPLCLVVGAEGAGLSRLVRDRCDWLVSIPMVGKVESLNAAVAGSIVLAAARQARMDAEARRLAGETGDEGSKRPDPLARLKQAFEDEDESEPGEA
jgi:23S rRNA (guanosine2251-2'-O)-methyltransferase